MRRTLIGALLLVLLFVTVPAARVAPQVGLPSASQDLVPVNVYVVDRNGKPVTDLKQSDFTVIENGSPQLVRSFNAQTLVAGTPAAQAAPAVRRAISLAPQAGRYFVIVIGLGRLESAAGYITAIINFAKTKLLPQDAVAIFAYDRAMPFTTDQQKIVATLERIKKSHEDVDFSLSQQLGETGMAPLYGKRTLPAKLQAKIDDLVLGPGAKPAEAITSEIIDLDKFSQLTFDDFMSSCATTLQDLSNLMAVAEYLRRYEGEKHILFVTEKGFIGPSDESDRALASIANDARASIHSFQAGGVLKAEADKEMNATVQQALSLKSLRAISDLTGGTTGILEKGQAAIDRLDEVTRNGYLLGYRPTMGGYDGSYRNIEVRVNRPDVKVYHRHGYFREAEMGGFNRRGYIVNDRISQAGNFRRTVNDIKVKASASQKGGDKLVVQGEINLQKVVFATANGQRTATLNVAIFGFDNGENPMGATTDQIQIALSEADYAKYQKSAYPFTLNLAAIRGMQKFRFIVYDFGSDLIGRTDAPLY